MIYRESNAIATLKNHFIKSDLAFHYCGATLMEIEIYFESLKLALK